MDKIIKLLSSNSAFFNLLKSNLNLRGFAFLYLKNKKAIIKFIIEKTNNFSSFITPKSYNISIFKTISAKNAMKIIKKIPKIEAIK